jgi:hypothetical protein
MITPSFTEEFILNPDYYQVCHMPPGYRRFRIEYGFECGCPEGVIYTPKDVDFDVLDKIEELMKEMWKHESNSRGPDASGA